jgi:uncharacterized protein (DUF305 family)
LPLATLRALLSAVSAAVLLAACGPADSAGGSGTEPSAADAADTAFAQQMIVHHDGAIAMAELADGRTDRPEVLELADAIIQTQSAETAELDGMLARMGAGRAPIGHGEHGMDHDDMGMATEAQLTRLEDARGPEFDRLFLEAMITHHQGAIGMARTVLAEGRDPELAEVADAVISAQQAEIEQMRRWQRDWGLD